MGFFTDYSRSVWHTGLDFTLPGILYRHICPGVATCDKLTGRPKFVETGKPYLTTTHVLKMCHTISLIQCCLYNVIRAFFHLPRLRQVRRLLGCDVTANLVNSFVLSRLDYGNALLVGLSYTTIAPVQVTTRPQRCRETRVRPTSA